MSGKGGRKKIILDEEEEEDYEVAAPLPSLKSGSSQNQGSSLPPSDEPLTSNGSSVPSRKEQPSPASKKIDLVAEEDNEEVEIVPRSNGRSSSSSSSSSSSRSAASSSSTSSSSSNSSKRGSSAQAKRVKAEPMEEDEDFVETGSTTNGRSTSSASASSAEKKRKRSVIQAESEDDDFDAAAEEDEEEEPEDEDADFEPAEKPKSSAPVVKKQKVSSTKARSTKKEKDTKKKGSRSTSSSSSSTKKRTPSTKSGSSSSTSRRRKTAEADGKAKKAATTSRKGKKAVKKEGAEGGEEMEVVEGEEEQWKWWLDEPLPKGVKWRTLEHNGVLFPPPYQPHGVKMMYDGEEVDLTPEQEEVATFYAQYLETPHTKKEVFNRNFFKEFRKMLKSTPQTYKKITQFQKCDFRPINRFLQQRKEERQNRTKEEKLAEKEEKQKELDLYGWAMVDGHKQKVGNFRVEPPGLFLGRGAHPKTGHLKQRIQPEDITINIGKEAIVPECPIPGHKWGAIVHNNEVTWLAFWRENINGAFKYVWLAPSSRIKGMADMKKFENSRKLCKHIYKIRRTYEREMKAKEKVVRQRATALWVIDHLALRVGNEKGEDEADTVGCCSLRVEHVKLKKPNIIKFDFLGKDSMRYKNSVEVPRQVFRNFKLFMKGKKPSADLFDHLTTTNLNAHLKEQMKGLTAKVFRTYNASITLEKELAKPIDPEATVAEKVLFYNRANREVAILCNHQRSLPPKHTEQMERLKEKKDELLAEKKELRRRLKLAKQGKRMEKEWTIPRKVKKEEKKEGAAADGKGKSKAKAATAAKKDEKKPVKEEKLTKSLPVDSDKIKAAITRLDARINACEVKMTEKEELKTVALGTSKINYLDPRITAAWCKRVGVPIEKIFNKTLRAKFPWAMDVDAGWAYHPDGPGAYAKEEERKSGSSSSSSSKSRRSSTSSSKEEKKNEEKKEEAAEEEGMEEYVDEEIEEVEEEIEEEEEEVEEEEAEEDAQDSAYEEE
ncbi:DNA topoisomerase I [Balamuthia mandrillaris]